MASPKKSSPIVKAVDPIWESITADAERIAKHEPVLSSLVTSAILNQDDFASALISRISEAITHPEHSIDLVRQTMAETGADHPEIDDAARSDLVATLERDPACDRAIMPLLYFKGYQAVQTYRFAHAMWNDGRHDLALYLQSRASQTFQVDINPEVRMGKGIMLDHGTGVVIGQTAVIGDHVSLLQGVTLGGTGKESGDRHPKVGTGVLIGAGAKILGNIKIGDCARVAAGSVVLKDVPERTTVAGVPAKIIGEAGCAQPSSKMDQLVFTYDMTS